MVSHSENSILLKTNLIGLKGLSVEHPKGPGLVLLYWRGFKSRRGIGVWEKS